MMRTKLEPATPQERQIRESVRAFLLIATPEEIRGELQLSLDRRDLWRSMCIAELLCEIEPREIRPCECGHCDVTLTKRDQLGRLVCDVCRRIWVPTATFDARRVEFDGENSDA